MNEPTYPEPILPTAFADAMRAIIPKNTRTRWGRQFYDAQVGHIEADDLMCELLKTLGYRDGVEVFEGMKKWYA